VKSRYALCVSKIVKKRKADRACGTPAYIAPEFSETKAMKALLLISGVLV